VVRAYDASASIIETTLQANMELNCTVGCPITLLSFHRLESSK